MSIFCKALLEYFPKKTLIQILENETFSVDCADHQTPLKCVANACKYGFRCELLQILINRIREDEEEISILCMAIRLGATAEQIKYLVMHEASLNACDHHYSPLICATGNNVKLTAALVKFLIENGTYFKDREGIEEADDIVYLLKYPNQLTPLQRALKKCCYEVDAIELLLDLPGNDAPDEDGLSLLHFAVLNPHCKQEVIEMLLNRGLSPNTKDAKGRSALVLARNNKDLDPSIIELLTKYSGKMESGSSVDLESHSKSVFRRRFDNSNNPNAIAARVQALTEFAEYI